VFREVNREFVERKLKD